jgi:hypothetical protein
MDASNVIQLRPREFYAVVPGAATPGKDSEPEPVFYARTFDGMNSAIVHAQLLSAGGGTQEVTLTQGRKTKTILRFENSQDVTGTLAPDPHRTAVVPEPGVVIRLGAPRGHIPEICSTAKNRAAGRRPRRNPNCPPCEWPGLTESR